MLISPRDLRPGDVADLGTGRSVVQLVEALTDTPSGDVWVELYNLEDERMGSLVTSSDDVACLFLRRRDDSNPR